VIIEIMDPVGGFKYTLDTETKTAHRQVLSTPQSRMAMAAQQRPAADTAAVRSGTMFAPSTGVGGGGRGSEGQLSSVTWGPAGAGAAAAETRPRIAHEELGTQSFDGTMAKGTRTTMTYPAGSVGNDRDFSSVSENWMAPDLKITILSKNNDPRNGEFTMRLENLSRALPDPVLFMVPADYAVVDEAGGFTIQFHR
jgi:hypothetical protein